MTWGLVGIFSSLSILQKDLSGPYFVNLDHHWVIGKWMNIQAPFSPQGDRGQGAMEVDIELASPIGTGTAEDPGRRHVCGTIHG